MQKVIIQTIAIDLKAMIDASEHLFDPARCEVCGVGTQQPAAGAAECEVCPKGTFKAEQTTDDCAPCSLDWAMIVETLRIPNIQPENHMVCSSNLMGRCKWTGHQSPNEEANLTVCRCTTRPQASDKTSQPSKTKDYSDLYLWSQIIGCHHLVRFVKLLQRTIRFFTGLTL